MRPLALRELLGTLIGDLIVAEAHAARASTDFLKNAGFKNGDRDYWGSLRFVTFSFSVQEPDGDKTRTLRVPLLSLVPIPLLQIAQAEYEFFAKINEVKVRAAAPRRAKRGTAHAGPDLSRSDLLCEVAPYASEAASEKGTGIPKMRVKITMRQADLPAGLSSSLRRIEESSGSITK